MSLTETFSTRNVQKRAAGWGWGCVSKVTAIGASSRQLAVESAVRGSNHVGVPGRIKLKVVMVRFCFGVVCLEDVSDILTAPVMGSSLNIKAQTSLWAASYTGNFRFQFSVLALVVRLSRTNTEIVLINRQLPSSLALPDFLLIVNV